MGLIAWLTLPEAFYRATSAHAAGSPSLQGKSITPGALDPQRQAALQKLLSELKAGDPFSLEESSILRKFESGGAVSELEADTVISRALYDRFILSKELTREQQELLARYSQFVSRRSTDIADLKAELLNKRKAAAANAPPRNTPLVIPANDQCAGAEVINGAGPYPVFSAVTADVTDATTTGDPPAPSCQTQQSRSIWYRFTPNATGTYIISSCSFDGTSTTVDDTIMAIYTSSTGACGGVFTELPTAGTSDGCGDDECVSEVLQASIMTTLTGGTTYFIVVWEYDATAPTAGNTAVQLKISQMLPPANDSCATPTTLSLDTPIVGTNMNAFDDYQLSGAACFTGVAQNASAASGRDVVYSFTAPVAGNYSFTVTNYSTLSNLVVYAATSCPAATPGVPVVVATCAAASNRHNSGTSEEIKCLALTANQTAFVIVDESTLSDPDIGGSGFTIEANLCIQESEANDTPGTADVFVCGIEGTISPGTDADFYSIGTPASGSRIFALVNSNAANSTDLDLRVTSTTDTLEYDDFNNADPFGELGPNIAGAQANGAALFLRVNAFSGAAAEPYRVYAAIQPSSASATAETEPNGTTATANSATNNYFSGTLPGPAPSTDVDVFSFTASAGDTIFIGLDGDPERNNTPIDAAVDLLDSAGAVLLTVNDSGATSNNSPSPGTLTGSTPASPSEGLIWKARTTGTYYARVTIGTTGNLPITAGNYLLSISRNCSIGASSGLSISGSVDYGITDCDPTTLEGRPVPGVTLLGVGAATKSTASAAGGSYTLSGLVSNSDYTVVPSKTGDVNGISTTDATRILQELTAPGTINSCQSQAGDATNNGSLSTTDATRILQFLSGTPVAGNTTGNWRFIPASRSYNPLTANQTNQNYEALLIGDVTGNWVPPALRSTQRVNAPTGTAIPVTLPDAAAGPGQMITIPILVPSLTGQGVEGFQFTLTFNPAILDFLNSDTAGTISAGSLVSENETPPGTVNLAAARATPYTGSGTLINLKFMVQASATPGATTTLQFTQFNFGEGPPANFSDTGLFTATAPTAVRISGLGATAYDGGVFLQWNTGFEASNLGFNIYRAEKRGLTRINPDILAGSALVTGAAPLTAGKSYGWWDDTPAAKRGALYYIEDIDVNGTRTLHGPVAPVSIGGDPPPHSRPELLSQLGKGEPIISYPPVGLPEQAPGRFSVPGLAAAGKQINVVDPSGMAAVKLAVRDRGWHRVTQAQLLAAGLSPGVDPRQLQLYVDGQELPMRVVGESDGSLDPGDTLEFYGVGLDTAVTNLHTYWVVAGQTAGQRIQQVAGGGGLPGDGSFRFTVERKDRTIYFSALRNGETENFFGSVIGSSPVNKDVNLLNVNLAATEEALLEVGLQGVTTVGHRVGVALNGAPLGEIDFVSQSAGSATFSVAHSLLKEGANDVSLVSLNGGSDISLVDFLRVTYEHTYKADNDELQFTSAGNEQVSVGGFTSNQIKVMDVTNPAGVQELLGSVQAFKDGTYAITVSIPGGGAKTLLAFADAQAKQPVRIAANAPSTWRKPSNGGDLLIITHSNFLAAAATLRAHRQGQGYAVTVINNEDIYDEFSYGNVTPQAVKDFLTYARTTWKRPPRYVLFLGDASFDGKNYLGFGNFDFVQTKLFDSYFMETSSDDWFADANDDGIPELAVGRLPVRTPQDATAMVAKVIRYDQNSPSDEMLLVADLNDGYDFEAMTTALKPLITIEVKVSQLNRGQTDINTARAKLFDALNRGPKIVNYSGHGSVDQWKADLLNVADAPNIANTNRLSVFIMMTCLNGYFNDASIDSLGEALMRQNGGAAAVWASTGMCLPDGQSLMNQEMYRQMFSTTGGRRPTLGEAAMRAKAASPDTDVRKTWVLLGDPTTRLR
jgi:hypothetical protein